MNNPEIGNKDIFGIDIEMSKDREYPLHKNGELYEHIKTAFLLKGWFHILQ